MAFAEPWQAEPTSWMTARMSQFYAKSPVPDALVKPAREANSTEQLPEIQPKSMQSGGRQGSKGEATPAQSVGRQGSKGEAGIWVNPGLLRQMERRLSSKEKPSDRSVLQDERRKSSKDRSSSRSVFSESSSTAQDVIVSARHMIASRVQEVEKTDSPQSSAQASLPRMCVPILQSGIECTEKPMSDVSTDTSDKRLPNTSTDAASHGRLSCDTCGFMSVPAEFCSECGTYRSADRTVAESDGKQCMPVKGHAVKPGREPTRPKGDPTGRNRKRHSSKSQFQEDSSPADVTISRENEPTADPKVGLGDLDTKTRSMSHHSNDSVVPPSSLGARRRSAPAAVKIVRRDPAKFRQQGRSHTEPDTPAVGKALEQKPITKALQRRRSIGCASELQSLQDVRSCPKGHMLELSLVGVYMCKSGKTSHCCSKCNRQSVAASESIYQCTVCGYDVCEFCLDQDVSQQKIGSTPKTCKKMAALSTTAGVSVPAEWQTNDYV